MPRQDDSHETDEAKDSSLTRLVDVEAKLERSPSCTSLAAAHEPNSAVTVDSQETMLLKQATPSLKSPELDYFVIKARNGDRRNRIKWPQGNFKHQSVHFVFEAVSHMAGRTDFDRVICTLSTFAGDLEILIDRGSETQFESAMKEFREEMRIAYRDQKKLGKNFKMHIEPMYRDSTPTEVLDEGDDDMSEDLI